MKPKSLYANNRVHTLQTIWIWASAFAIPSILRAFFNSFWLWALVSLAAWVIVSWIGISLISLLDYNHRMATKYNIKIENIPLYEKIFNELVEKESQGIDTSGIPSEIQDVQEWLRFCRWQLDVDLKNSPLITRYEYLIAQDYYNTLKQDKIGECKAIGFKQEYDRALFEIASEVTSNRSFAMNIMNNLYTKIFYPISETSLSIFKNHVESAIQDVAKHDHKLYRVINQNHEVVGLIFNLWLSQMVVHEEATRNIELLKKRKEMGF